MARLPVSGSDEGSWGDILNEFLSVSLTSNGSIKASAIALKADDSAVVHLTGDESVSGVKTFSSSPILPTPTSTTQASTKGYVDTQVAASLLTRVNSLTSSNGTYTPNCATTDLAKISTPSGDFVIANPQNTPSDGQKLMLRILSGSTGYTASWGSNYISSGSASLPTSTLPASKTITLGFVYDSAAAKWVLLAADTIGY